jgi:hypothetical protein
MSDIGEPLDQEKLLLMQDQQHVKMDEIIQVNLIKYGLMEERLNQLEQFQREYERDRS